MPADIALVVLICVQNETKKQRCVALLCVIVAGVECTSSLS